MIIDSQKVAKIIQSSPLYFTILKIPLPAYPHYKKPNMEKRKKTSEEMKFVEREFC